MPKGKGTYGKKGVRPPKKSRKKANKAAKKKKY